MVYSCGYQTVTKYPYLKFSLTTLLKRIVVELQLQQTGNHQRNNGHTDSGTMGTIENFTLLLGLNTLDVINRILTTAS